MIADIFINARYVQDDGLGFGYSGGCSMKRKLSLKLSQIINKPPGEVWRGSALPLHFQSILAACT